MQKVSVSNIFPGISKNFKNYLFYPCVLQTEEHVLVIANNGYSRPFLVYNHLKIAESMISERKNKQPQKAQSCN